MTACYSLVQPVAHPTAATGLLRVMEAALGARNGLLEMSALFESWLDSPRNRRRILAVDATKRERLPIFLK